MNMAEKNVRDLKDLIGTSEEICNLLYEHNVGNCRSRVTGLGTEMYLEFLKFAVYLADADTILSEHEKQCIEDYLKYTVDDEILLDIKQKNGIDTRYHKEIPAIMKYAVLADAGRKIPRDRFHNQKAQILFDTYNLFGQTIVANKEEMNEAAVKRLTKYIQMLEKFLKDYGVFFTSSQKFYKVANDKKKGILKTEKKENAPKEISEETKEQQEVELSPEERIEKALESLDALVGLEGVKEEVHSLVNLMKVRKLREANGLKNTSMSMHMVFSGNPGTGKTTVARMISEIYSALGVLETGQLVEVDRSGLVRGFIGQTATRVQEVVDEAIGGILFIDEAYSLCVGKGEGDFGQEAIDTLLKAMEDHREDLVVIVAGYPDLMEEFLDSNPGLKSRFNKHILFEDYSPEEQLNILKNMCEKQDYVMTEEALSRAFAWMQKRWEQKVENFANARDVRNFMERAISCQATRVVQIQNPDKTALQTIEAADIDAVVNG